MEFLEICTDLVIPLSEIILTAVRSQGAGGQHVNKTATAIHLRFDIGTSSLPEDLKQRLLYSGDSRVNTAGCFVTKAQQARSQIQNRDQALLQLKLFIIKALKVRRVRKPTKPTKSAKVKRVETKKQRGQTKQLRQKVTD